MPLTPKIWGSKDLSTFIQIDENVVKKIISYTQRQQNSLEAGGILLGEIRFPYVCITKITSPFWLDNRRKNSFIRAKFPHSIIAFFCWLFSKGHVRYLGEWHTHNQDFPLPSSIDIDEWKNLASQRKDRRRFIGIIAGRKTLRIFTVNREGDIERFRKIRF